MNIFEVNGTFYISDLDQGNSIRKKMLNFNDIEEMQGL